MPLQRPRLGGGPSPLPTCAYHIHTAGRHAGGARPARIRDAARGAIGGEGHNLLPICTHPIDPGPENHPPSHQQSDNCTPRSGRTALPVPNPTALGCQGTTATYTRERTPRPRYHVASHRLPSDAAHAVRTARTRGGACACRRGTDQGAAQHTEHTQQARRARPGCNGLCWSQHAAAAPTRARETRCMGARRVTSVSQKTLAKALRRAHTEQVLSRACGMPRRAHTGVWLRGESVGRGVPGAARVAPELPAA